MTALSLYQSNDDATTITTAKKLYSSSGSSSQTSHSTKVGTSTGYGLLVPQGDSSSAWSAAGSMPAANGKGLLFDATTLEGQTIAAGNWQTVIRGNVNTGSIVADIIVRYYKYSGGTYTSIGQTVLTAQTIGTTATDYTTVAASLSAMSFATGDKLYIDVGFNITTNSTGSGTATFSWSGFGTGVANVGRAAYNTSTPGYSSTPANALSGTLPGVGNIVGTLSYTGPVALVGTLPGVGQLAAALSVNNPLAVVAGGFKVTLAGQDITAWTDEMTLDIERTLAQGAGTGSGSGRASTCSFQTALGPAATAIGAGQAISGTTYSRGILADNPLLYYRFGELTGSPKDSVSGASPLTLSGVYTQGVASLLKNDPDLAIKFDGSTGYASLSTTGSLPTGNAPWTLAALFKMDSLPSGSPAALVKFGTFLTNKAAYIGITSAGKPIVSIFGNLDLVATSSVGVGSIHLLEGVFDGTTLYMYLDGSLVMQGNPGTTPNITASTLTIGGIPGQSRYFPGTVDEVAVFNYALSTSRSSMYWSIATNGVKPSLVRQGEVIIYDKAGVKVWGGYATNFEDDTDFTTNYTTIGCHDYWQDLDRVEVNELYAGVSDTYIINDLCTKYAPWLDLSALVLTQNYLFLRQKFAGKSVRDTLQKVANTTGFSVWVDADKKLHYASPAAAQTAPFSLSSAPDKVQSFSHIVGKYEQDDTSIINKVTFIGGNRPSDDFTQDLSIQANGTNTTFVLAYYPHPASDGKVHILVNGTEQAVGKSFADTTKPANVLKSAGGNADCLLDSSAKTVTFDVAPDNNGPFTVSAVYRHQIPLVLQLSNPDSISFFGRSYESHVSDETVFDVQTAQQRCRLLLAEQAYGLVHLSVVCWKAGIVPGMLLKVTNTVRGINASYIVQKVKVVPLGGGNFEYEIDLGAWNWQLVDLLLQQAQATAYQPNSEDDVNTTVIQVAQYNQTINANITVTLSSRTTGNYLARTTAVGDGRDAYAGLCTAG